MGIRAEVQGNLTKHPGSRVVVVDGEPRKITEIRVFADVSRRSGDGWQQDEERSCAVDVTIWNETLGEAVMAHYRKGMRVVVLGDLHLNEYADGDGRHHAGLRMTAETTAILPYRLEVVTPAPKRGAVGSGDAEGQQDLLSAQAGGAQAERAVAG